MSMLAVNFAPAEAPSVDAASSSRSRRDVDAPSTSGTNAFAATLATAMHAPAAPAAKLKKDGANSELDAHAAKAVARIAGKVAANASGNASANAASDVASNTGASGVGAGAHAGKPAFAAAAEARAAAATAPVDSPNADADALNPDFRTRLARVVSRMHDEFGKDVDIVEGFRTQSRQDHLYEQGRGSPGDVVTWTKASKHTLGLAADVTIDGGYTDTAGFQQLAQIAAQEGLRTLGPKDPGHIEMPTRGGAAAWGDSNPVDAVKIDDNVSRAIGIAMDQSNVTDNARDDGDGVNNFNGLLSRVGRNASTGMPQIQMPMMSGNGMAGNGMAGNGGGMSGNMFQRDRGDALKDSTTSGDTAKVANVADVASVASIAQVAQVAHVAAPSQPMVIGAQVPQTANVGSGTDAADKVGKLLDARDAAPAQPLSQVTLNVDNAAGGADKITVQLRAGVVDTAISVGDPNRADKMSLRIGELQHALEQHGLDATAISVASTSAGSGPGWNPRQGSDQSAQNGRPSLNHRDNRQDADATRQRSRREQQGGRQK
jgi:hypothetical protein